jgi:hypothetical protein
VTQAGDLGASRLDTVAQSAGLGAFPQELRPAAPALGVGLLL